MAIATISHIEVDEAGVARIAGTTTKVIEIALDKLVHESSPEEMHFQYPYLSLAQIHAALTYYYDHQLELDAEIQRVWQSVQQMAAAQPVSPLRQRLVELKRASQLQQHARDNSL